MPNKNLTLQATAKPTEQGFKILAISAGEAKGHGIKFSDTVLKSAVMEYENKPVFIDHSELFTSQSVRNLAGTLTDASWNTNENG